MRITFVPDLDKYQKVQTEYGGCGDCVFRKMVNVKCSAIPCQPSVARPYPVIYKEKN